MRAVFGADHFVNSTQKRYVARGNLEILTFTKTE